MAVVLAVVCAQVDALRPRSAHLGRWTGCTVVIDGLWEENHHHHHHNPRHHRHPHKLTITEVDAVAVVAVMAVVFFHPSPPSPRPSTCSNTRHPSPSIHTAGISGTLQPGWVAGCPVRRATLHSFVYLFVLLFCVPPNYYVFLVHTLICHIPPLLKWT